MRFIVSCNRKRISLFPKLSLSSTSTQYSQPTELLINYLEVCKSTAYSTITEDLEVVRTLNNNNNKSKSSISASTRKTIKNIITTLVNEGAINNKIVTLLKLMTQGDNLITMNQDLKKKLISKLRDVESFTNSGNRLADLLEDVEDSMTVYEKQKAEDSREVLNTFSSSLPSYSSTRKSLKEILAEKTNKKIEEAKKENSFSAFKSMMEEIKEEVMNEELEEDEEDFEPDFDPDEF
jgi:cytochrome c-type biogenesis protein CcmH/NrfF